MEIIGTITQVHPLQEGIAKATGKPWKMQPFVLQTQEQYPRTIYIELFGEERINANPIENGQIVTVSFDLDSREFNGRWYTSIRAWRVQQGAVVAAPDQPVAAPYQATPQAPVQPAQPAANTQPFAAPAASLDDASGLPF